jgi:hypothetical protein
VKENCDNYVNSVLATLALINELRWDGKTRELRKTPKYEVGRRMTTSEHNRVSPAATVTPDIVVQTDAKFGVVGEVTTKLASDETSWREKLLQLKKYDDDLLGWWTEDERVDLHDIVLLLHLSRAIHVSDILSSDSEKAKLLAEASRAIDDAEADADMTDAVINEVLENAMLEPEVDAPITFDRQLSVVGFERSTGANKECITLKKEYGELSDVDVSSRLRRSVRVPLETLVVEYHDKKFVDHEPPMPLLLQIIWEDLFTAYLTDEFPVDAEKGYTPMLLSVERITNDLRKYYGYPSDGHRSPQVPRQKWVRKALDRLVQFGLGHVDGTNYVIHYKRLKGDALKRFGKMLNDASTEVRRKREPEQLLLDVKTNVEV